MGKILDFVGCKGIEDFFGNFVGPLLIGRFDVKVRSHGEIKR
jgi:hypothetical protein